MEVGAGRWMYTLIEVRAPQVPLAHVQRRLKHDTYAYNSLFLSFGRLHTYLRWVVDLAILAGWLKK